LLILDLQLDGSHSKYLLRVKHVVGFISSDG
jgi:hypothetical protein